MAFEAYLQQDRLRPRRGRRITYLVSAIVHGVAVLGAVAYSFWHVEELSPPNVTVTFISAASAPPPPPPPPPLGGAPSAKHRPVMRPHLEVTPKVTDIVQPKVETVKEPPQEIPKEVTKPDEEPAKTENGNGEGTAAGVKGGVAGGVKGGVVGGVVGGAGTTPALVRPKFLPPQMGQQQKISGAAPDFPTHLSTAGAHYTLRAQVCVTSSGSVESVTLKNHAHPELDANVLAALKGWRYRPLMANNVAVPFCYFVVHEFKSE
jgi:protein TonB